MVRRRATMLFNSDPAAGAIKPANGDGSRFSVQLNQPLMIPRNAKAVEVAVTQASIINNNPSRALGPLRPRLVPEHSVRE